MNDHPMKHVRQISILLLLLPLFAGCAGLHKAAGRGDLAGVERFLREGVDVDSLDPYGRTPLMCAGSDLAVVQYLVEHGADVNAQDINGETPLMKAAFLGRLDVVQYLVEHGADVNARSQRGETALMMTFRELSLVKFLVEHGADVNAADNEGETVLMRAAVQGRLGIVQYLLANGATAEVEAAGGGK